MKDEMTQKEFKQIEDNVANNIMSKLHPLLMEIQTEQNAQRNLIKGLDDALKTITKHPMFTAWNTTTSGVELFKLIGKILLYVSGIIIAFKTIGGSILFEIKKHL